VAHGNGCLEEATTRKTLNTAELAWELLTLDHDTRFRRLVELDRQAATYRAMAATLDRWGRGNWEKALQNALHCTPPVTPCNAFCPGTGAWNLQRK
jgi:hypothetical protein